MKKLLLFTCYFIFIIPSYSQKEFWGMTSEGGANNAGVIFKTDGSGDNYSLQHTMFRYDGDYPKADLIKASDGKLYGITSACCVFDGQSVLFQYDLTTSTYTKKFTFKDTIDGTKAYGSLIEASDGKLYGLTSLGGIQNLGAIFQYDPVTSVYTKLFDFDGATHGSGPQGSLIQAPDGKLYGLTLKGGAHNFGVLFQYDPGTKIFTNKFDFDGIARGSGPQGSLLAVNGMLYGMTSSGGANELGVIFRYDPLTSTYTNMFDFDGTNSGSSPSGCLTKAPDGTLYGMTTYGGAMDMGVLFQYKPADSSYVKKIEFNNTVDGSYPWGSLLLAADGNFYGMTHDGGVNDLGVLFQYVISSSTYTKKFDFSSSVGGHPCGSLIQDTDGTFYGMTNDGGINNVGVLFQVNPSNFQYTKKLDFHFSASGSFPMGALMQGSDGMLYGTTRNGGVNEDGVIFQYDKNNGTYTKRFDFNKATSGRSPSGSLVQTADGKLYGTATYGGAMDKGVLFRYDPANNIFTKMIDFDGTAKGGNPWGALLKAADGKLYGMTQSGGANDLGVIFQYDPSTPPYYTKMFDFNSTGGKLPEGALVQGKDGAFYGMTNQGGANDLGVIFRYDPSTPPYYTTLLDFDDANGSNPQGSLIRASDDNLYGMTNRGGANDFGVLFQYKTSGSNAYTKEFDFNGALNGSFPSGSLIQASDGKLYGLTSEGGKNNMGVLFQFDPNNSGACVTKIDFDGKNGMDPSRISLLEIASTNSIIDPDSREREVHVYPNPSDGKLMVVLNRKVVNASLKLVAVTGQSMLLMENFSGDRLSLNISEQAQGIYFMEIIENNAVSRVKIAKN